MQVLASLRKRTKSGVSTWTFIIDNEMKVCYAVGGEDLKVIRAKDKQHLRAIFNNFVSYGYTRKLPKVSKVDPPTPQIIEDPWVAA